MEGTLLVTDLKRRVEEQLALPSATQTLVFRGKTLTGAFYARDVLSPLNPLLPYFCDIREVSGAP